MNSTIPLYALAVALLAGIRLFMVRASRKGQPFFSQKALEINTWSLWQLLLASFLTLFAELAFIRWIAVEVRVFAYFKNLALLLCFVGFGLGCALARKSVRWVIAIESFLGLLLVIRVPLQNRKFLEGLSQSLGGAADVQIWGASATWNWTQFLTGALMAGVLFLLLVWIFIPLGQMVSRQIDLAPSQLAAYSWNLLGSLIGILAFLAVGRMMFSPWVWLGTVLIGFSLLQTNSRDRILTMTFLV